MMLAAANFYISQAFLKTKCGKKERISDAP